jgi:hypothetical protein
MFFLKKKEKKIYIFLIIIFYYLCPKKIYFLKQFLHTGIYLFESPIKI